MNTLKSKSNTVANILKAHKNILPTLHVGDLVEGPILEKRSSRIFVDLGKFGTGVIYRNEIQNAKSLVKDLEVGDIIHGKVIDIDNEEGLIEMSISEADKQKAWAEVQELQEKEEIIKVKINGFNKGGLVTEVKGLVAFLPVSHLAPEHYPKFGEEEKHKILQALQLFVGKELSVRVIDVNHRTNKLIVSEKAALKSSFKELIANYEVGQVVDGIISGVADFGAFMKFADNPELEGFIHISEIDWKTLNNPKEVLKIDDTVKAKIIDIKDGKIFLSLKALKENPWEEVDKKFKVGEEVEGEVYMFTPVGTIVNLPHNLQGLVKVTDFGGISEMKKQLSLGSKYTFKIEEIKPEEKRIYLSLKK